MLSDRIKIFRNSNPDVEKVRLQLHVQHIGSGLMQRLHQYTLGLSFKLTLLIISLLIFTAGGISLVVISIMDDLQLQSMIERGASVSSAIVSSASFSLPAGDRLALDNLVNRVSNSQPDLDFIAIVDHNQKVVAHNHLERVGTIMPETSGVPIGNSAGLDIRKVAGKNGWVFVFTTPIEFNDRAIGNIVAGINDSGFTRAGLKARNKIILIITLLLPLALGGAFLLSRLFTHPVEKLSEGVERLRSGDDSVIVPITSNDELAVLTRNFNEMAKQLSAQHRNLVNYSEELERSYADIVKILAAALDARDNYTYGHSSRVAQLSVAIGRKIGLKPYELKELEMTCLLHDIGKIRIPDSILNKPGHLDPEEYQHIMDHPYHGVQILELTTSLKKYIPAVLHHHERHDGSGYPGKLAGNDIPFYARILSIADAYDAMTSSRPYRAGLTRQAAITELIKFKGRQFAPELVDVFIDALDEYGDVCDIPLTRMHAC